MKLSRRKMMSFSAGVVALAMVAGTFAFYSGTGSLENKMTTDAYSDELFEEFTPGEWQPGDSWDKVVTVKNDGDYNLVVRIKLEEDWERNGASILDAALNSTQAKFSSVTAAYSATQTSETDGDTNGDDSVVYKNLTNTTDWVKGTDGYWYYTGVLAPAAATTTFMDKIVLATNTDMGKHNQVNYYTKAATAPGTATTDYGTTAAEAATKWVPYTGDMPEGTTFSRSVSVPDTAHQGYSKAEYTLKVTYETLQATKAALDGTASWSSGVPAAVKTGWALT